LAPRYGSILFDCPSGVDASVTSFINPGQGNNTTNVANSLSGFVNGPTETGRTAIDPTTLSPFFQAAPYIGAVRNNSDNWWRGWTCGLEASSSC
jgi:hypothetical protein